MENPEPTPVAAVPAHERPAQDEWGLYDPEQAGFEALMRKLTAPHPKPVAHATTPAKSAKTA
ncbi:MAG: hypothetical protein HY048_09830 [Acidobacteria bacterium]|nr:hypothetical protein [Acidobacteriota bacterium]